MFTTVTIRQYERGLDYRKGRFAGVLEPGQYRLWVFEGRAILKVDVRETALQVTGQEVLTADNVPGRLSLLVRYRVVDPAKAIHEVASFSDALHQATQLAARDAVVSMELEQFLAQRMTLGEGLTKTVADAAARFGVDVSLVAVKDAVLDADLRAAYQAKLTADQRGQAALIEARHKVATARAEANAAKVYTENPAVMANRQLDILQQAAQHGYGNHFVFLPDTVAEIARKLAAGGNAPAEGE